MSWDGLETQLNHIARRAGMRDVPPAAMAAVIVAAVLAVAWGAWRWWPRDTVSPSSSAATIIEQQAGVSSSPATGNAAKPATASVLVHVVGAVRHPGVYQLPDGSRAIDAVDAAGGLMGDAAVASVNLARPVTDGEQLVVPDEDEATDGVSVSGPPAVAASGHGAAAQADSRVNINTADAALLDTLPGVGPSTAAKIVADRDASGPYASVDDLSRVSGIGPKKLEQLRELACVQ